VSSSLPQPRVPVQGAVDLAALAAAREAQAKAAERVAAGVEAPPSLVIDVTEATFQSQVLDLSFEVPVVIDLWAEWCGPCKQLSPVLERLVAEDAGRWVLAKVDVDVEQRIAQAFAVQSIPSVFVVLKGTPQPLFQGALPAAQVREAIDEVLRVAEANGINGRVAPGEAVEPPAEEPEGDPRFDVAYDAIEAGDWDAAEAAYRDILASTPTDPDANAGLSQVAILRRTEGVDPETALTAADADPDSLPAQSLAADVELLTGRVDEAFARIVELVRRTSGDDRAAARDHLLSLFTLVGDGDPRVITARTALANALF
jgi:putative thioredoxin